MIFSRDWTRKVSSGPIMICETQDSNKDKYQVDLVFQEGWSSSKDDFSQEESLKDLVFDFVDLKTGKSVNRLGQILPTGEKFQLVISWISDRWGVSFQSKLNKYASRSGDWTSLDCTTNNFAVEGKACDTACTSGMCNQARDFKDIKFDYDAGNNKTSSRKISRVISITSWSNLKWKESFKTEVVFAR